MDGRKGRSNQHQPTLFSERISSFYSHCNVYILFEHMKCTTVLSKSPWISICKIFLENLDRSWSYCHVYKLIPITIIMQPAMLLSPVTSSTKLVNTVLVFVCVTFKGTSSLPWDWCGLPCLVQLKPGYTCWTTVILEHWMMELLASNNHCFNYRNFFHNDVNALSKKKKKKKKRKEKRKEKEKRRRRSRKRKKEKG